MSTSKPQAYIDRLRKVIYSPDQISQAAWDLVVYHAEHKEEGVVTGIPGMDGHGKMMPIFNDQMGVICGLPSSGKSYHTARIMANNALGLAATGAQNKVVVSWTGEETIEHYGLGDLVRTTKISMERILMGELDRKELDELRRAQEDRARLPWWVIGHSEKDRKKEMLTLTDIREALYIIQDEYKMEIHLFCLDYLQRINRADQRGDIFEKFLNLVDACKTLPMQVGTPEILVTQAKQELANQAIGIPGMYDAQFTSNVGQSADWFQGTWMPKFKYPTGHILQIGSNYATVHEGLMLVQLAKQKKGKAPVDFAYWIRPDTGFYAMNAWTPEEDYKAWKAKKSSKRLKDYE